MRIILFPLNGSVLVLTTNPIPYIGDFKIDCSQSSKVANYTKISTKASLTQIGGNFLDGLVSVR